MPDVKRFGDDVVEAMGDMSQREIMEKMAEHGVRVSQGMISNMRHGRLPENMKVLRAFAEAVDKNPDEWEIKARLYGTEVHLRADHKALSDKTIAQILSDIAEEEEKHQNKIPH